MDNDVGPQLRKAAAEGAEAVEDLGAISPAEDAVAITERCLQSVAGTKSRIALGQRELAMATGGGHRIKWLMTMRTEHAQGLADSAVSTRTDFL